LGFKGFRCLPSKIHRFAKAAESKTYAEELKGKMLLWIRNN
jgi:hypothetical protein